ncbi:MAG TPA: flagellar basal body L-ring protein FlgH [Methylomirabilota bacterium]|nr:flagellar basal body L-ring protein FlgH [Methylomirabilota bacterium]
MKSSDQCSVVGYCQSKVKSRGKRLPGAFRFAYGVLLTAYCMLSSSCAQQMKVRFNPQPTQEELSQEVMRASLAAVPRAASGPVSAGSLWPADDRTFFYGDRKAYRVGDVLTVRVSESAKASNAADTDLSRKTENKAKLTALLGLQGALASSDLTNFLDVTSDSSHKGAGSTTREGKLTASITTVVKQVLPNGNLIIQGTRSVLVNHEEQFMTLTGIVRPEDINRDNTVSSSQIADARIVFGGVGIVDDKQRSGWGTWVFDWLFPF